MSTNLMRYAGADGPAWGAVRAGHRSCRCRRVPHHGRRAGEGAKVASLVPIADADAASTLAAVEGAEPGAPGPGLLPGRQLPVAHGRVRDGPGPGVQHAVHQVHRLADRPGRRHRHPAARAAARLRGRARHRDRQGRSPARSPSPTPNLADYVGAFVLANDVSARDVQLPQGQWYKGKSYPTFCPVGPYLCIPDPDEVSRWRELRLTLSVNGESAAGLTGRRHGLPPAATLTEFSGWSDFQVGDLLLTGTPGGVALQPPKALAQRIVGLLPEAKKWELFVRSQAKSSAYLKPGDRVDRVHPHRRRRPRPRHPAQHGPVIAMNQSTFRWSSSAPAPPAPARRSCSASAASAAWSWSAGRTSTRCPRAVHFDDEVFRIFAEMGLADEVRAISRPMPGMQLIDPEHRVLAEFTRDATGLHGYPAGQHVRPARAGARAPRPAEPAAAGRVPRRRGGHRGRRAGPGAGRYRAATRSPAPVPAPRPRCGPTTCSAATAPTAAPAPPSARPWRTSASSSSGWSSTWHSPEPLDVYDGVQQVCDHDRAATFMRGDRRPLPLGVPAAPGETPEDFDQRQGSWS